MPSLIIHIAPGDPRRFWCEVCLTSGGIEIDLYAMSGTTISKIATHRTCSTCEENDDE